VARLLCNVEELLLAAALNAELHILISQKASYETIPYTVSISDEEVKSFMRISGICGGQSGAEEGFLRVLRFPLPVFIPPNFPSS
jgi:hypothetical protein